MTDFIMSFPELRLSVKVEPLAKNRKLYDWFLENLPLKGVQSHAVVSGKIIYIMNLRMKKPSPVRYRDLAVEDLSEAKDGRIFIFITAGKVGSVSVKYGEVSENMSYPVLGQVKGKDLKKLEEIGEAVWKSLYSTKEVITAEFLRGKKGRSS
jgi:hypothetical protein